MAKSLALVFGIILILLGVLGFIMPSPLLGYFDVDMIHNIIHIVLGLWLVMGSRGMNAKGTLRWVGIITLLVGILGLALVTGSGKLFGLVTVNAAGNWLHVVVGALLLIFSMGGGKSGTMQRPMGGSPMSPGGPQM